MMLKRLASIGAIAALGVMAVNATITVASQQTGNRPNVSDKLSLAMQLVEDETPPPGIARRERAQKTPTEDLALPASSTGRLIVKFRDGVKARAGGVAQVTSLNGYSLEQVHAAIAAAGATVRPALGKSADVLSSLEQRAMDASLRAQPDLAGMLYVEDFPSDEAMLNVARRLNDLAIVEFVEIERPVFPMAMLDGPIPQDVADARRSPAARLARANAVDSGPVVEQLNAQLNLRRSVVTSLSVPDQLVPGTEITIPIEGIATRLHLEPSPVFAPDFQMYVSEPTGAIVPTPLDTSRVFQGTLPGMPGGATAGVILDEGLFAMAQLPDGRRYWVEPVSHHLAEAGPGQHVIYAEDDIDGSCGSCGVNQVHHVLPPELQEQIEQQAQNGSVLGGGPCHAEFALDLDYPWVERAGSVGDAGQLAGGVIAVVNLQYEDEVSISHAITAIVVRATPSADPYVGTNPGDLLEQFRDHWNDNFAGVFQYDIAHLFTGRETGGVIGVAYLGVVCLSPSNRYGLSSRQGSFGCQTDLTAHEIGHNWNATHCDCAGGTPEENFTMNPFITCANQHADASIAQIEAFRDFVAPTCLDCGGDTPPGGGCGLGANDCFTASPDPYCNVTQCCATVCAIDPTCCSDAWDADCVALANEWCTGGCGEPDAGHCLSANGSPGCTNDTCCNTVIGIAPHCEIVWDEECAILAHLACFLGVEPDEPTPDLTAFQAYRTFDTTPGFAFLTTFLTGDSFGGEGFDLPRLFSLGEELLDKGVGEENLTRGKTLRVGVIEDAVYANHEDLDIIVEPGLTMWLNETFTAPSHGTAVAGIIGAVDNGYGMTGIASEAELHFFPAFALETGGRLLGAISSALAEFGPGDVLNFSIGFDSDTGFECTPGGAIITASLGVATLIQLGTDIGITSVISAGNECCNLDNTDDAIDDGESGAVVVSACDPGFPFCRRDFSNFSRTPEPWEEETGLGPHFSGWGVAVATLGGNADLYGFDLDSNPERTYTAAFSGTSAAAPMIAGGITCVQGMNKQFFGVPLGPRTVRGTWEGYQQCGLPQPDPALLGSWDDPVENPLGACDGDIYPQDPDDPDVPEGTPNYIGPFPDVFFWAGELITGDWFNSNNPINAVHVVRGQHQFGNHFAVKNIDGIVLQATSQFTEPGDHPSFHPPNIRDQVGDATYLVAAQTVDVIAEGEGPAGELDGLTVDLVAGPTPVTCLVFLQAYDWDNQRWAILGGNLIPAGVQHVVVSLPYATFDPERFVRDSDRKVLVRAWAAGFRTSSGPGQPTQVPFVWNVDRILIDADSSGVFPGD